MEAVYATQDVKEVMDKITKVFESLSSDEETQPPSEVLKLKRVVIDPTKISWKQYNKTVSENQFQRTTLARMQQFSVKKREAIQKAKEAEERKFIEAHSYKPNIDSKSKAMVSGSKPLYMRAGKVIEDWTGKISEKRQSKAEAKERLEQSFSFRPTLIDTRAYTGQTTLIDRNEKWNENKQKSIAEKQAAKKNKEIDGITFKPTITSKALKQVFDSDVQTRCIRFGEISKERLQSKRSERISSFSPTINSHNFLTPRGDVHDRLYSLRKSMSPKKYLKSRASEEVLSEESFETEATEKKGTLDSLLRL